MLKIENERDLITGGISADQLKTVASLPLWGQKRPSIEECTCYIIGLIQSRLATLSDDEDNGETSHCKGICDYGVKIAEEYAQSTHDDLERDNLERDNLERDNRDKKAILEDGIYGACVEVYDIGYTLGYYQALIDRNIYGIRD